MDSTFTRILKRLEIFFLYATLAVVPLIFTPATTELFELPKYTAFYFCTFAALMCFLGRSVLLKHLSWRRTPLDLPLVALWIAMLFGSALSLSPYESFFGDFSFLGISFLALSAFIIYYWLLVQHVVSLRQVFNCLLIILSSGLVGVLYFMCRTFNWFNLPASLLAINPLAVSNTVWGLFLIILVVAALTMLAIRRTSLPVTLLSAVVLVLSLAGILLIGFSVIWILLAVAVALSLIFFLTYLDQLRSWWSSLAFGLLVGAILFSVLGTPAWFTSRRPAEVNLGYTYSWNIAHDAFVKGSWKNRIVGTGPGTYIYNFSLLRPAELNLEPFWTSRFYHSASTALDWLTENGLVSSLLWIGIMLIILGVVFATWFKTIQDIRKLGGYSIPGEFTSTPPDESPLIFWGVTVCWLMLAVGVCVLSLGAAHLVLFWALAACLVSASFALGSTPVSYKEISLRTTPQYALILSFGFILIFTGIIVLGIYFTRFITAELVYTKSTTAKLDDRITLLNKAIELNGSRAFFYLNLGDAWLAKAVELSQDEKRVNESYLSLSAAIQSAKTATTIAPTNVAGWQLLSTAYTAATSVTPDAATWIAQSLTRAVELDPANPIIQVSLSNIHASNKQYPEAIADLNRAITLKPNFLEAYVRLGIVYEAQGKTKEALESLQRGFAYGKNNADYLVQFGRYYFNGKGENYEAIAEVLFQQAVYLNPSHSDGLFSLAVLKERQGKKAEALELYRKVLVLNPGNKELIAKINSLSAPSDASADTTPAPTTKKAR